MEINFEISDITGVGCFNPQPDLDSFSNNINNGNDDLLDSAEECYYLCIDNPECEFFVWHGSPGKYYKTCWLKNVFNRNDHSPGALSGFVTDDCRGK